ncbi:MAG: hypothetical protein FJ112_04105 [Deltaproteobacteria bacterium]|nr:hypothetical protein [Deltaproteobacteria bacterium]
MEDTSKIKTWISEKAPSLAILYKNKYVGMVYDRFASLPPKKQKQVVLYSFGSVIALVLIYLVSSYFSLWSLSSATRNIYSMNNMILEYQKHRRDRSEELTLLMRNAPLAAPGQLRQVLLQAAGVNGISPRMIQIEERGEAGVGGDPKKKEVRIKESAVSLQKVNLSQAINYLKTIEYGNYNLIVSSIKITNDDKLRGYLNVDISIMAHLFENDEG